MDLLSASGKGAMGIHTSGTHSRQKQLNTGHRQTGKCFTVSAPLQIICFLHMLC